MFKKLLKKKCIFISCLFFLLYTTLISETYSSQQLIPAGHWIYDAIYTLYAENAKCSIADMAPLSVNELRFYFNDIDYESLSYSGKILYDKISEFFSDKKFEINFEPVKVGVNVLLYPELLYKNNENINWSFASDYTNLSGETNNYGAASSFSGNSFTRPFITIPIYIDFSDLIMIETDASLSKNYWGFSKNSNFTNIFYTGKDFEFSWPLSANASTGYLFSNGLGINLNVARSGLQIGKTQTGSILYNNSFQTDFYVNFNIYSKKIKYSMNVVQVNNQKYLYLHTLEATPWKWIKASITEGTLLNSSFELRYLNPLMIMHSFASWEQYMSGDDEKIYGEAHIGQYMGVNVEITPYKNLRLYGTVAVTETQSVYELGSAVADSIPDGIGGQFGLDFTIPDNRHGGFFLGNIEGIYTSPYLYIKQGADWSFYNDSHCMQQNYGIPYCSWIGTPFGPDSTGCQITLTYNKQGEFNISGSYLYLAHGENSFGLFNKKVSIYEELELSDGKNKKINEKEYYAYYPSVRYKMKKYLENNPDKIISDDTVLLTAEEGKEIARGYNLTGIIQYTNQFKVKGTYFINNHFKVDGQIIYNLIINNQHKNEKLEHGIEIDLGCEAKLF